MRLLIINTLLLVFFINNSLLAQTKEITLQDIWLKGAFQPQYLYGLNWMKDSRYYTAQEFDYLTNSVNIVRFDIKTGKKLEVLLEGANLKSSAGEPLFIDNYSFSPDESQILLAVNEQQIYRRSSKADYYIYDLPSKKLISLTKGKVMHPEYSPDGSKVAFVRDNNLFYKDLKSKKEVAVTSDGVPNQIINGNADWVYEEEFEFSRAFFWSPDSKKMAFYRFDESEVKEYSMQVWDGLYPENYVYKYPKAGEKNAEVSIYAYALDNSSTVKMNTGEEKDQYIPRVKWTTDSDVLSIQRLNRKQNHFEILHANATTGKSKVVYEEKNDTYIEIRDDLTYFKNGKQFLLLSEKDGYRHIYLFDISGKEVKQLTKGEWEVRDLVAVDEKRKLIYYSSTEVSPMQNHLYSVKPDGKGKNQILKIPGYHEVDISPDKDYLIDYYSTIDKPYEIDVFSLPSGKQLKELVSNTALSKKMGDYGVTKPEFITFNTNGNIKLNGWMLKPSDFDSSKKYPVLVTVYGGPGHQSVTDQWLGPNYLWYQMLAQKGYIILAIDNRGTGGRGSKFKKLTQNNLGKYELEDVIETAKYLSTLAYVDEKRIGIFGWSFGGYLTSLAMTLGSDFYKMGIAVAPVTSWRFYDTIYTERFLGLPDENAKGYDENSPITHADKLKGKYLLIHGTADDNVHVQNSIEMQEALNAAGKQYDIFYYPNKNHGIYGGNTRYHLYTMMTDYILKNL